MKASQIKSLFFITVLLTIITGFTLLNKNNPHQKIKNDTEEIFNKLIEIRRDFHQYPELAGDEKRTSKIIADYLSNLGLEVKTNVAGYGVIGILKGKKEGKHIAWRAEMDALPHDFIEKVYYKSKNKGIQHGCGHDVHMAIGLGIAEVLSKNKKVINGTIYFIFQPEEETFNGAKKIVNSTLYSKLNIDEIYAAHVTALHEGRIMAKPNEVFAYQKRIQITFKDKLSKTDANKLYSKIRNEMLRVNDEANPWEFQKVFDPIVGISNYNTFFKDYRFLDANFTIKIELNQLHIKANLYETNKLNLSSILPKIEQIINNSEFKNEFIKTSYILENPTVQNDKKLTDNAIKIINNIYGKETVLKSYGQVPYFNDDFTYFQQKTPGVYFLLGGSNFEKGIIAMNHAPSFRVDEKCIKTAVKSFSSLIVERSNRE